MKRGTLALALTAALSTLSGCLTLGDTNEVYPPTVGRELSDLRMSAERGAMSPQEYEAKKAQILAGRRGGQGRGGAPAAAADPFNDPSMGMAQAPSDPQWQQGYGQPPEGFNPQMQAMQMQQPMGMSPQDMQFQQQQQQQYSPEMLQQHMQQQQQQPQTQQLPAEGWH